MKGAPCEVLSLCNSVYLDGKKQPLTDETRNVILRHLDDFASEGLRVLGLAYREVEKQDNYSPSDVEMELASSGPIYLKTTTMCLAGIIVSQI